jgi:HEAT repeat protein
MSQRRAAVIASSSRHCALLRGLMAFAAAATSALTLGGCSFFQLSHPSLKSPDPSLRIPAIKKAAATHDTAAIPTLVRGLQSTDPAIRFYCAYALKQITGRQLGFVYYAPLVQRQLAIARWNQWISAHVTAKAPAGGNR